MSETLRDCVESIILDVIFFSEVDKNAEFAQLVHQKLDAYKADDHTMGQVCKA